MQEFFMNYGLYLLVALLVVIAIVFILSKGKPTVETPAEAADPVAAPPADVTPATPPAPLAATLAQPMPTPVVAAPDMAPVAPVAPLPADPIPASPAIAALASEGDDLMKMKGIGAKLNALLIELGVTRYQQIADWTDADIAAIDARLGNFKGRPVRDHWVDQARLLAAGDLAGYEARYGKL